MNKLKIINTVFYYAFMLTWWPLKFIFISMLFSCLQCFKHSFFRTTLLRFSSSRKNSGSLTFRQSNLLSDGPNTNSCVPGDGAYKHPNRPYLRAMNRLHEKEDAVEPQGTGVSALSGFPIGNQRDWRFDNSTGQDMELSFLGTASCSPSGSRGVSCLAMRYGGSRFDLIFVAFLIYYNLLRCVHSVGYLTVEKVH